ncbi:MAG: hypothetical protein MUF07_13230 [Steroidobacteraceae bacterium]|nr:hypothetical protein [Steroidobacteraceae bacterium]
MATQQNAAAVPRRDGRAGGALDAETRQQVTELNRLAIDALCGQLAADPRVPRPQPGPPQLRRRRGGVAAPRVAPRAPAPQPCAAEAATTAPSPVMLALGPAWLGLDDAGRGALAACPYLVVELDVSRLLGPSPPGGWVSEAGGAPPQSVPPGSLRPVAGEPASAPWAHAARMVFQYAWHFARVSPVLAGFVLGLPGRDVEALRGVRLSQADALLPRVPPCVALRWRDDAALWSGWLAAAQARDAVALRACELRGLQRLAGACRPAPPPP